MADWQFKLEFKDLWKGEEAGELSLIDVTKGVVERIGKLLPEIRARAARTVSADALLASTLEDMADELENDALPMFEELVETENEDTEDFDLALEVLYDWADSPLDNNFGGKKMCWINTF